MEEQINYTELLQREYGQDEAAMDLAQQWRTELGYSDEKIYHFLESFY